MHRIANTWAEFNELWQGPLNFKMAPSLAELSFDFPPLDQVVDELRQDDKASAGAGTKGNSLLKGFESLQAFRAIPIDTLMTQSFSLAHFSLSVFDAPGRCLHGFGKKVLEPWQNKLTLAGFTWERCYPIIFISGRGSATNYHMDFSHVFAWQIHGQKRFCGLRRPDQWANKQTRLSYANERQPKPESILEEDSLCYDMRPGDMLWNTILTPHWVEAGDEPAMSINISHGGLRLHGVLAPNEQELEDYRIAEPDLAPKKFNATY